jgi:hypothetical protein
MAAAPSVHSHLRDGGGGPAGGRGRRGLGALRPGPPGGVEETWRREEAWLRREEQQRQEARCRVEQGRRQQARRLAWQEREAQLRAAAAEQRPALDPHSTWEEALWSAWPESPARSSYNGASPPGDIVDGDDAHRD